MPSNLIDETPKTIVQRALPLVREVFALDYHDGIHGVAHWTRVWHHGKTLALELDVNPRIPAWFAFLHDSQRHNDHTDPEHGARASDYALALRDQGLLGLNNHDFDALCFAMQKHSDGLTEADQAVQICWDADRLDLGRVGIEPDPFYLCTSVAKQASIIERAVALSEGLNRRDFAGFQEPGMAKPSRSLRF